MSITRWYDAFAQRISPKMEATFRLLAELVVNALLLVTAVGIGLYYPVIVLVLGALAVVVYFAVFIFIPRWEELRDAAVDRRRERKCDAQN